MILTYSRNGKSYETDSDKLSPQSAQYLLQYGWAQSLQDAIAGREKKVINEWMEISGHATDDLGLKDAIASDLDGALLKRSDGILSGSITTKSVREERDPLRAIAIGMVRKKAQLLGKKLTKEKLAEFVEHLLTNNRAKVELEMERQKVESADVELDM